MMLFRLHQYNLFSEFFTYIEAWSVPLFLSHTIMLLIVLVLLFIRKDPSSHLLDAINMFLFVLSLVNLLTYLNRVLYSGLFLFWDDTLGWHYWEMQYHSSYVTTYLGLLFVVPKIRKMLFLSFVISITINFVPLAYRNYLHNSYLPDTCRFFPYHYSILELFGWTLVFCVLILGLYYGINKINKTIFTKSQRI